MSFLFTSDWHLTEKAKDAYRWDIFPWLTKQAINRDIKAIFILGDITDFKNHHSNEFLNRIVDELRDLASHCPVYAIAGNHDYTDPSTPLLRFLKEPGIRFYSQPKSLEIKDYKFLLIPNEKSANAFKRKLTELKAEEHDFVLMHQTFKGSIMSNGTELDGFASNLSSLVNKTIFISGDVHVPQTVGDVHYCGAPHPVHFGDTFTPRVLYWDGTSLKSITRVTTKKRVIEVTNDAELKALTADTGDHVKVILKLSHDDFPSWEDKKAYIDNLAKKGKWTLANFEVQTTEMSTPLIGRPSKVAESMETTFDKFCAYNEIKPELAEYGKRFLFD